MDFLGFLRARLIARGITQKELAEQLGVSHVSLNKWLNGRMHPRSSTIAKIVAALQEDISGRSEVAFEHADRSAGGAPGIDPTDGTTSSVVHALDGLSWASRRFIVKMVEELKRASEGSADPFAASISSPVADFANLLADMPGVAFRAISGEDGAVKCVYVSPRSRDIVGRDPAELLTGQDLPYRKIVAEEDRAWVIRAMEEFLVTGKTGNEWRASFRISTTNGMPLWIDARTRMTIRDGRRRQVDGLIVRTVAEVTDGKIGELRSRDPRTNLCSRTYFLRLLARALDDIGDKESVAVIVLQIADFKSISAIYGLAWQDALHRVLAERLTGLVRRTDVAGHIDDGVFAVIIVGKLNSSMFQKIAAKLAFGLTGSHQLSGQNVPIVAHGAVTIAKQRGHDAIALLRRTVDMAHDLSSAPTTGVGLYDMDAEYGASFEATGGAA